MSWLIFFLGFFIGITVFEDTDSVWVGLQSGITAYLLFRLHTVSQHINQLNQQLKTLINQKNRQENQHPKTTNNNTDSENTPPPIANLDSINNESDPWRITKNTTASNQHDNNITNNTNTGNNQPIWRPLITLWHNFFKPYLFAGNWFVKGGLIVLFFGIGFLLRYSVEQNLLPIELRIIGISLLGVGLLWLGFRLRHSKYFYGLLLQGGGIGILYLSTFTSLYFYQLLTPIPTFTLLFMLVCSAMLLAVLQNAQSLAIVSLIGGFLAPILVSTEQVNYLILFTYYLILNLGITGVALLKTWRLINLLGFFFTFIIASLWGNEYYKPQYFTSIEPFLILHIILYTIISITFTKKQTGGNQHKLIDTSLVFGVPIVGFALQGAIVKDIDYGLAISAFCSSVYYGLIALFLQKKYPGLKLLRQSFIALAIVFFTITVPLVFDGRWTASLWAVEGAALVWIGIQQNRRLVQYFGILLQLLGGINLLADSYRLTDSLPIINSVALGLFLMSVTGFISSYILYQLTQQQNKDTMSKFDQLLALGLLVWASIWWLALGQSEIDHFLPFRFELPMLVAFLAGTAIGIEQLKKYLDWPWLGYQIYPILVMLSFLVMIYAIAGRLPLSDGGLIAWPLAVFALYHLLKNNLIIQGHLAAAAYSIIISSLLLSLGIYRWLSYTTFDYSSWLAASTLIVITICSFLAYQHRLLPFIDHHTLNQRYLKHYFFIYCVIWVWFSAFNNTGASFSVYLPILNPADLVLIATAISLRQHYYAQNHQPSTLIKNISGTIGFIAVNAIILRAISQWLNINYNIDSLMNSSIVQTTLSISWTLISLLTIYIASQRNIRPLWIAAAGLMGIVIIKLFIIDLENSGTIERIISFIGVGLLMLIIGYIAPLPTKSSALKTSEKQTTRGE